MSAAEDTTSFDAERPLGAYALLAGAYVGLLGGVVAAARRRDLLLDRVDAGDLALLAIGAHRLSRMLSREKVSRPLRRPFTRVDPDAPSPPGELAEDVRPGQTPLRRAVADLLTCTICMDQWTATAFTAGYLAAPRATRTVATVLAVRSGADALQLGHARMVREARR